MERGRHRYNNWVVGIMVCFLLLFAAAAMHDMQTVEGVGLYFALKKGMDRRPFDLAADVAALLGLLLLTLLPCVPPTRRNIASYFRMLTAFLAFMPQLSLTYLIHLFDTGEDYSLDPLLFVLQTAAPLLCLLAAAMSLRADAVSEDEKRIVGSNVSWIGPVWKKWYSICCVAAVMLTAAAFLLPFQQQLFDFIRSYLLLLVCFDLWERLYCMYPALNRWGWIIFGGLDLRVVYVLAEIMKKY